MQQTYMVKTNPPNALQLVKTKELKSHMVTTKERKVPYGAMTMLRTKRPKAQNHLVLVENWQRGTKVASCIGSSSLGLQRCSIDYDGRCRRR